MKIDFKRPIMESLEFIRKELTDEDISLITFFRHSHCHMHLHYIWHSAKVKDGKIIDIKQPYDPSARDIAFKAISKYNGQNNVAFAYAQRLVKRLEQLEKSIINAARI